VQNNTTSDNFCGPEGEQQETGLGLAMVELFEHVPVNGPHIFAFISDGDFVCSQDRREYLRKEFERLHIRMFVFAVGHQWATGEGETPAFREFLQMVGGEVIPLQDPVQFAKGWEHIKQLANSGVHKERIRLRQDALLILLSIAFGALLAAILLSWIRRSSSL
jgi:hypothetical protein